MLFVKHVYKLEILKRNFTQFRTCRVHRLDLGCLAVEYSRGELKGLDSRFFYKHVSRS